MKILIRELWYQIQTTFGNIVYFLGRNKKEKKRDLIIVEEGVKQEIGVCNDKKIENDVGEEDTFKLEVLRKEDFNEKEVVGISKLEPNVQASIEQDIAENIDKRYLFHLEKVRELDKFSILRNKILDEFRNVKLVGAIEINDEEYELLCQYFRKKYKMIEKQVKDKVVDIPFSIAVVQIAIREYDGNFWNHIGRVLQIESVAWYQKKLIAGSFIETMEKLGKPTSHENEYVANVMMHCFITDHFLERFFEYLFQYYNLDLERSLSETGEIESEYICNCIVESSSKRQQLLSKYIFLSIMEDFDYCKKIIAELLVAIDQSFWDQEVTSITSFKMKERFNIWKEKSDFFQVEKRNYQRNDKADADNERKKYYKTPYLECDLENARFYIILPSQLIKSNNGENIVWKIKSQLEREYECECKKVYAVYKTNEIRFEIERGEAFEEFRFELLEEGKVQHSFVWEKQNVIFIDEMGNWLKGEQLKEGSCFAFSEVGTKITSEGLLSSRVRKGLRFYEFDLSYGDFICIDEKTNYYIGENITEGLTKSGIYKGLCLATEIDENIPIYKKLPLIIVEVENGQLQGTAIIVNGKKARLSEVDFINIVYSKDINKKYYCFKIDRNSEIQEGWNEILIDFPGGKQRYYEFGYVKDLEYTFLDSPYIFVNRGILQINREIENDKLLLEHKKMEKSEYNFSLKTLKQSCISLCTKISQKELEIRFEVPVFMYGFKENDWHIEKPEDIWHADFPEMLYVRYPSEKLAIEMNKTKYPFQQTYKSNKNGEFLCDLTKLKSYFDNSLVIQSIDICINNMRFECLRRIGKSYFVNGRLEGDYERESVVGVVEIIGKGEYCADLFYENEMIAEKIPIIDQRVEIKIEIQTGSYTMKLYEKEDDEFGFDISYTLIGSVTSDLLNVSDLTTKNVHIKKIIGIGQNPNLSLNGKYHYEITDLVKRDMHTYEGRLYVIFGTDFQSACFVRMVIPNLNKVHEVFLYFIDEEEENNEFLYDSYYQALVQCEDKKYSKAEVYLRYEYTIFQDDFLFVVEYQPYSDRYKEKIDQFLATKGKKTSIKDIDIWK